MQRRFSPMRGRTVGRTSAALLVGVLALGTLGATTAAAGPPGLERKLNAAVDGTVSVTSGSACGGIVEAITDLAVTGSPALGAATLRLDVCVTSTTPNDEFFGTFSFASRFGTLTGTVVISSPDPPGADPQRTTGTLMPTGGTG